MLLLHVQKMTETHATNRPCRFFCWFVLYLFQQGSRGGSAGAVKAQLRCSSRR